ncbi:tRNA(His) guanylyltransferase Thg1 family protein [uncultured Methanobacterium sp.]|uniref:tRNA(His) guanylyltransferase Thg1 family protein n=1 Tax=uncultured Methanobacterium sp. TaxID=176306 RepID=UPI002AA78350|nr:tRNA(His) guanylyltransferase Thg1 family protein [uncultured Methanobacterium sp.]
MKEYEIFSSLKVPFTSPTVVRLDGRNFSQLSRKLEFEKPYDPEFVRIISEAARLLFQEFSPKLAYVFSDEVNLLLGEIPFAGRVEKIDSVMASFLCGAFTRKIMEQDEFKEKISETKPISFDSRVIPLSRDKVMEYFQWRQLESWRNCLNGYSYWTLREDHSREEAMKILHKKKSSQLHDLLFEKGIKIAHMPTWQRRGIGIYKKGFEIEGLNPLTHEKVISQRKKIFVDWELPLFDEEFFRGNSLLK